MGIYKPHLVLKTLGDTLDHVLHQNETNWHIIQQKGQGVSCAVLNGCPGLSLLGCDRGGLRLACPCTSQPVADLLPDSTCPPVKSGRMTQFAPEITTSMLIHIAAATAAELLQLLSADCQSNCLMVPATAANVLLLLLLALLAGATTCWFES